MMIRRIILQRTKLCIMIQANIRILSNFFLNTIDCDGRVEVPTRITRNDCSQNDELIVHQRLKRLL